MCGADGMQLSTPPCKSETIHAFVVTAPTRNSANILGRSRNRQHETIIDVTSYYLVNWNLFDLLIFLFYTLEII